MTAYLTRRNSTRGCCGGLSTLRGTPPQHLFDVDLFWNDPRDSNSAFKHRSILKMCLESLWVAMGGSWAPFWELWGSIFGTKLVNFGSLGSPWHPKKTKRKKELKKEALAHFRTPILETILASFFVDFFVYFSVRFLDHFWTHLGAILGVKMEQKSAQNPFKIRSKFWLDF